MDYQTGYDKNPNLTTSKYTKTSKNSSSLAKTQYFTKIRNDLQTLFTKGPIIDIKSINPSNLSEY